MTTEPKKEIYVGKEKFSLFLSEEEILRKVAEIGRQITLDYKDKVPIFIGILNGSFIFFADLLKFVEIECEVDFFKLSSYGDAKISSGKVQKLKDLNCEVVDRDLIIVEDIIDTGLSVNYIRKILEPQEPRSLKVVSLLVKAESIKYETKIDYIGFQIPDKFVIGYGLDYAQKYRNLRSIYVLSD